VGKVAISDVLLKKPGKFTAKERKIMEAHTYLGARLFLNKQSEMDEVSAIVSLTHHENWDGTGYPGRVDISTGKPLKKTKDSRAVCLKGKEIPIYGRVVALADVYDALRSKRVYKEAWTEEDVLHEMQKLSGQKFDPDLVAVFFDILDLIRSITARYPDSD